MWNLRFVGIRLWPNFPQHSSLFVVVLLSPPQQKINLRHFSRAAVRDAAAAHPRGGGRPHGGAAQLQRGGILLLPHPARTGHRTESPQRPVENQQITRTNRGLRLRRIRICGLADLYVMNGSVLFGKIKHSGHNLLVRCCVCFCVWFLYRIVLVQCLVSIVCYCHWSCCYELIFTHCYPIGIYSKSFTFL